MAVLDLQITKHGVTERVIDVDLIKKQLKVIWGEILQEDASSFSDQDAFFEVGGDSISAQNLSIAAQKQGILLTMEQIFMQASLEEMATVADIVDVEDQDETGDSLIPEPFSLLSANTCKQDQIDSIASICNVTPTNVQNAYPCSSMQEALVALSDDINNLSVRQLVYRLTDSSPLVLNQFYAAWRDTVRAHPVLRSRICHLGQGLGYVQAVIAEDILWNMVDMDLTQFLQADSSLPMHKGDPFFRYTIVTDNDIDGQIRHHFVWTVHHASCDSSSILEILDEVSRRFQGETSFPRVKATRRSI